MPVPDDRPYAPPLPPDAGPRERMLHEVYGFASALVEDTANDWGQTADGVRALATEVRSVISRLRSADEPWEGPAADSAYSTLRVLARALDARADEIEDIRKGLEQAAATARTAESAYRTRVRSVSTYVDPDDYRPEGGGTFNTTGYEAAVDGRRAEREAAAGEVLDGFTAGMGAAARQMPVDAPDDTVMVDATPPGGPGPGGRGPGGPGGSSGTPYAPPTGTPWPPPGSPTSVGPTGTPLTSSGPGGGSGHPGVGASLDGGSTGTTAPGGGGSPTWAGGPTSGGVAGGSVGSVGGVAGAAGAGGLLSGGAALLGRGAFGRAGLAGGPGGPGTAGRSGPVVAGSSGSTTRGASGAARGAGSTGSAAGAGRPVVAPGAQGPVGRGGGSAVRGARPAGRYGVPRLEGAGAGRDGVVAGSAAGGRGRRERDETVDVDSLTHEDEETWFDGEDDASPPVWR